MYADNVRFDEIYNCIAIHISVVRDVGPSQYHMQTNAEDEPSSWMT